ncbi:MAG: malate dehydrogenase [Bacteroidales bacterium]|nr:malate dehydrogenase [Bacteroidales bacterium]
MAKVTVIGAGNVGATCANAIAHLNCVSDLVLIDIKEGLSEGKAIDMMQTAKLYGFDCRIIGVTNNYAATADSDVVIVTSGVPRKPGMTREDLIGVNAGIVNTVVKNAMQYSPDAVFLMIANPMDTMTYLTYKTSNKPKNKVIGMGGQLDSSRFTYYISQALGAAPSDVEGIVIGGHGDATMIPLISKATYKSQPVSQLISAEVAEKVIADTMVGGATLTKLLGTSAWYAPGAAAASMVKSIILDQKKIFPCCVALEGEYGKNDICIGVPAVLGRNGVEKIVEIELTEAEKEAFDKSAEAVSKTNSILKGMNLV